MRNALGQEIKVGVPVVLVSQGQGWVTIAVGRICKISAKGNPSIQYLNGSKSNAIMRPERLVAISEGEYDRHRDRFEAFTRYEEDFYTTGVAKKPRGQYWKSAYSEGKWGYEVDDKDFRDYINLRFVQDGMEPWYD